MAQCFCGCGREVRGFGTRGMNKQGRRTTGLLVKLRDAQARVERRDAIRHPKKAFIYFIARQQQQGVEVDSLPEADVFYAWLGEEIDTLLSAGQEFAGFWREVVHGDYLPPPSEAKETKRAWQQWGKTGMGMCSIVGIKIERGPGALARGRV